MHYFAAKTKTYDKTKIHAKIIFKKEAVTGNEIFFEGVRGMARIG